VTPCFADSQAVAQTVADRGSDMNFTRFGREAHRAAMAWLKKYGSSVSKLEEALDSFAPDAIIQVNCTFQALHYERSRAVPVMTTCTNYQTLKLSEAISDLAPPRPNFLPVSKYYDLPQIKVSSQVHITGAWTMHEKDAAQRTSYGSPKSWSALSRFLAKGARPVAFTWGSKASDQMHSLKLLFVVLRTLKKTGDRGVLIGGWMKLDELYKKFMLDTLSDCAIRIPDHEELLQIARKQVCVIQEVPYSWLFPKCSCVVHHGGLGTLQAAYEAACPQVIIPISLETYSVADLVPGMPCCQGGDKLLSNMEPEDLAHAIKRSVKHEHLVKQVGAMIRKETGTENAAQIVQEFLTEEVKTGKWEISLRNHMSAKRNNCDQIPAHKVMCAPTEVH